MKHQRGFTLIEVMIGIAMVASLSIAVLTVAKSASDSVEATASGDAASAAYVAVISKLSSPIAWANTVGNNSGMACLATNANCLGAGGAFKVYDDSGAIFYNAASATAGFNKSGQVCNTYGARGERDCIYHYDVQWKPLCKDVGSCIHPLVSVSGTMTAHSESKAATVFNPSSYSFSKIVGFRKNYVDKACEAFGGVYDVQSKTCRPTPTSVSCPQGQVVSGIDFQGKLTCVGAAIGTCGEKQGVGGFRSDGTIICIDRKVATIDKPETQAGSCPQASPRRNAGDVWSVSNGMHREEVACPGVVKAVQYRVFDDYLEVICQNSQVIATGKISKQPRAQLEGLCPSGSAATPTSGGSETPNVSKCPAGIAEGVMYWGAGVSNVESGACASDLAKSYTKNWQVKTQYRCTSGIGVATGIIDTQLLSEQTCPGACKDDEVATRDAKTGIVSCKQVDCITWKKIDAWPATIPARDTSHTCYYKKVFSVINPATSVGPRNENVIARDHDQGMQARPTHQMATSEPSFKLEGQRAVKISGNVSTTGPILVDNFLLTGRRSQEEPIVLNTWKASGTADCTILGYRDNTYIKVYGQDIKLETFATGGVATVNAYMLPSFSVFRPYTVNLNGMDCGGIQQMSAGYLIFQ